MQQSSYNLQFIIEFVHLCAQRLNVGLHSGDVLSKANHFLFGAERNKETAVLRLFDPDGNKADVITVGTDMAFTVVIRLILQDVIKR